MDFPAHTMPSLDSAAKLVRMFEGFRAEPYLDSAGIPTIGYGTTHYTDGTAVTMKADPVSEAEATAFLEHDLTDTAIHLWKFITRQPTMNQWAALLSISYNVGWPNIAKSSLLRYFNQGNLAGAAGQFLAWDKAHVDGQLVVVQGLLNRRNAERTLFLTEGDGM